MFYVKNVFNELVNLDKAQMIYMEIDRDMPLIEKIEPRYSVWAKFTPKYSQRLHTGTKEQCKSVFEEITLRLRMHNAGSTDCVLIQSERTPEE